MCFQVTSWGFGHNRVEDNPADGAGAPLVTQAYCSAISVSYSGCQAALWKPFASFVLDAAYEATMYAALENSLAHKDQTGAWRERERERERERPHTCSNTRLMYNTCVHTYTHTRIHAYTHTRTHARTLEHRGAEGVFDLLRRGCVWQPHVVDCLGDGSVVYSLQGCVQLATEHRAYIVGKKTRRPVTVSSVTMQD